jgi:uncharacterized 2Fe-2S/4Fe-4S cluster protein (DUF4445 family)
MSFIIEFEPLGIRLICEEPLTLLDAARQAGIRLRSECGGKGTCGKCRLKIISGKSSPISSHEKQILGNAQIKEGYRLACRTLVNQTVQVYLPPDSLVEKQVLQTEGKYTEFLPHPAVQVQSAELTPPSFTDLRSDLKRLTDATRQFGLELQPELGFVQQCGVQLRRSEWRVNLIHNHEEWLYAFPPGDLHPLGLAVDVGSTKIACYLMGLEDGSTLAAQGEINPQIIYGEDIMSRLSAIQEQPGRARDLQRLVIEGINEAASNMCRSQDRDIQEIADVCLVGNTAMHHFFLGLPSQPLAVSPYIPATTSFLYPRAADLGLQVMPNARAYCPPPIAGFVGSDHLAFLLSAGFGKDPRIRLGIDIGTNTEIALQHDQRIVSVSTASGPAFEGAHIRFGMRAAPGAIEHVTMDKNGLPACQVIGQSTASGICGSGILDAIGELRRVGLLNSRGRLDKNHPAIKIDEEGKPFYELMPAGDTQSSITLNQHDIDQLLLAKGAIRAGIEILLDYLKINAQQIEEVIIAGAFGSYMDPGQAIQIGLLPNIDQDKVHAVGNAAGAGARMMLVSIEMREQALALADIIEYLELTIYPDFPLFFARGIQF